MKGMGSENQRRMLAEHASGTLDLNLFIIFEAIFRNQSVTRAADEMGMSQSAVSHSLGRLRRHFDDQLFIKARKAMVPTRKAISLYEYAKEIVSLSKEAASFHENFAAAASSRRITLCVNDFGEMEILPKLYEQIRQLAPNCTLRTVAADGSALVDLIERGRADIAICGRLDFTGEIMQQSLFEHRYCAIVSVDSDLESPVTEEQYLAKEHVVFSPRKSQLPNQSYSPTWQRLAGERRVRLQTAHHMAVPLVVEKDPNLMAIVPHALSRVYMGAARIRIVPLAFELPVAIIYQYWHRRFDADPYHIWLRNLVRKLFN